MKRSTPTFMIYGELGVTPLSVEIKTRAISFWSKIVSGHAQPTRLLAKRIWFFLTYINQININLRTLKISKKI